MNKKFNVIKLSGLKGVLLIIFLIGCLVTGFCVFPGWVCMHLWNFTASFFPQMPSMSLLHGVILWGIVALSYYGLNRSDFGVSFNSVSPNEERIKQIIAQESAQLMLNEKKIAKDLKSDEKSNICEEDNIIK